MLISSPQELQEYLPSHHMDNLSSMMGFLNNSEHDFLEERIGAELHELLKEKYAELKDGDFVQRLTAEAECELSPSEKLITLCQRVIVFDAFARSADIRSVSVNINGFNSASADDYDSASPESIKAFKAQCVKESHAAVNRLLLQLEDWAKEQNPDEEKAEIVALWKKSKYFYRIEGLLITTATELNEFLDIYDSREKFIQLLPDLRYLQEVTLADEIGDSLLEDLTHKNLNGGNAEEQKAIRLLKRALALLLEDRNKMFKREAAHSESLQAIKVARGFIANHREAFDADAVQQSPFAVTASAPTAEESGWKNNRNGNVIFVTRPLH